MSLKNWIVVVFCTFLISVNSFAETQDTVKTQSKTSKSSVSTSNTDSVNLTDFSKKFWGLNDVEWNRYLMVKELARQLGKTPVSSTPPEVLSIFAEKEAERRRYAKLFAEKYDLYVKMLLASNKAIASVQAKMYADTPMLDPHAINQLRNSPLKAVDRIQYFTSIKDCASCDLILRKLIRQVRLYGVKLDLFIIGDAEESFIQDYAQRVIPSELVANGKVTINRDMGFVEKHSITVPKAFLSRNGAALEPHDPEI